MARALIPLTDGFEEIEAVTIVDVLRRGGVEVITAAIGDSLEVKGAQGIVMKADSPLKDVVDGEFDIIVLPGGPGTPKLGECELLMNRIHRQNEEHRLIGAICMAPVVLCNAGLIDPELQVTCYPTCALDMDRRCAEAPCVTDGNVITANAPGSAMLFALVILQALCGEAKAQRIARTLVTDALTMEFDPDMM